MDETSIRYNGLRAKRVRAALAICALAALTAAACVTPLPREQFSATPTPPTTVALPTPSPNPPTPTSAPAPTATPLDAAGLLDVRGPLDGATVETDSVVVHGFARAGAAVEVNGIETEQDDEGRFQHEVSLSPGVNSISVAASAPDGQLRTEALTVISLALPPQPFFLLVTQPEDQSVVAQPSIPVAGRTTPGAVVSVNGVALPVDVAGVFTTTLALEPGANIIDVVATNAEAEALHATIAVIYRP